MKYDDGLDAYREAFVENGDPSLVDADREQAGIVWGFMPGYRKEDFPAPVAPAREVIRSVRLMSGNLERAYFMTEWTDAERHDFQDAVSFLADVALGVELQAKADRREGIAPPRDEDAEHHAGPPLQNDTVNDG